MMIQESAPGRVSVLGLGNVLMGDDGFGPTVVRTLAALYELDSRVGVEDLGTPGLNLIPYVAGPDAVIVVDTVRSQGAPGELRFYDERQLAARPVSPRTNPHDPGLDEALRTAAVMGAAPRRVLVVGTIPGPAAKGTELGAAVEAAVMPAVEAVVERLAVWGFPSVRREEPAEPDLWWKLPVASRV